MDIFSSFLNECISDVEYEFNLKFKCLKRFKELYYLLKFKSQFRDWLWIKVRLPRIQNQYHPDHLDEFLCSVNDEDSDKRLDNW